MNELVDCNIPRVKPFSRSMAASYGRSEEPAEESGRAELPTQLSTVQGDSSSVKLE